MKIHPTAIVESGAHVGEGTEIGPHTVIYKHVTIGPNCKIHAGAVIGDTPQDLSFKNVESFVRIGANCVIRENVTIHRGTIEGSATAVGDQCYLMANSHLAHNVTLGNKVIMANGALLGGYVEVGDGAFISGNVVVHQFVRVGRLAMLAGLSAMSKDVPPFCTMRAACLNIVVGLNVIGMRRAGLSPAQRQEIKKAFSLLFRSGMNVSQAVEQIRLEFASGPARELADFAATSKRGICATSKADDSESDVDA